MITFGITGGIATGKSNITKTFRQYGVPIVDADVVARQVVSPGSDGLDKIISAFGKKFLNPEGELDREKLANLIFNNILAKLKLEFIMMPLIEKEVTSQLNKLHETNSIVGYDGALIIEMGSYNKYKPLIVVSCPKEIQLNRLMKRNNLTYNQAMSRINSQLSLKEKVKFADYIIDTSGTIENTATQVLSIFQELKKMDGKDS